MSAEYLDTIDQLETIIGEGKNVPLSSSVMIPKDEALALLAALRESIPAEHAQAKALLTDQDAILAEANRQADEVIAQAHARQERMLNKEEVVATANARAHDIVAKAEADAEALKTQADDFCDTKLANFEIVLGKTLKIVSRGREKLRRRLEAASAELEPFNLDDSGEISGAIPPPPPA